MAVYANKGAQIETSSNGTDEAQEVSFIAKDDIQDEDDILLGVLPCQLAPKELSPRSFTLPCTLKGPIKNSRKHLSKIDKFLFPSDFVLMDMMGEPNETMILGRPFLATIHAQIDVFNREISLGIGKDRVLFDMDGGVYHSKIPV
ncbi:MAK10-like protein, partial [Tanacetum coccineum]